MSKSPGFWFFTGDWLKDSELRFCSLFARGLLVDLLCLMFEAKERGYLSKPDGTPREDAEIVDAISGSNREEKLAALAELEASGVLSRDNRGVLYSRRLAKLGEISKTRSKAGSKGGSKTEAKPKQNDKQTDQQNTGVTVSVSDSVSDTDIYTHTHTQAEPLARQLGVIVPSEIEKDWQRWVNYRLSVDGRAPDPISSQANLMELCRRGFDKAKIDIDFSIRKNAKSILDSDQDFEQRASKPARAAKPKPVWSRS
jgi:hypothetical protein